MPKRINNVEQRKASLKMTVEINVAYCKALFDGRRPGEAVGDMLLCAAVLVGQAEGRELNASKIADYVGMARPTVIRRLAALEKKGLIERSGMNYLMPHELVNGDAIMEVCQRVSRMIVDTAAKLSKMDSEAIARPRNGK